MMKLKKEFIIFKDEFPESVGKAITRIWDKGKKEIISHYGKGYYGFKFKQVDWLVNEKRRTLMN